MNSTCGSKAMECVSRHFQKGAAAGVGAAAGGGLVVVVVRRRACSLACLGLGCSHRGRHIVPQAERHGLAAHVLGESHRLELFHVARIVEKAVEFETPRS